MSPHIIHFGSPDGTTHQADDDASPKPIMHFGSPTPNQGERESR